MSCCMVMYARELGGIPREAIFSRSWKEAEGQHPLNLPFLPCDFWDVQTNECREDAQSYGVSVELGRVSGTGVDSQRKPRE